MARPPRPPRRPQPQLSFDVGRTLNDLSFDTRRLGLRQAALLGFVVGVLFHACVVFAVLDDGSSPTSAGGSAGPEIVTNPQAAPTVTAVLDRTNCNEIRGTEYRSETERQWFQRNCS